jgi:phage host-nuclease inhibitor protein Gam
VNNKPWFNEECKVKRDEFHNARKKYASSKTPENKILLNTRAKEYRLVLNANYQKYTEKCSDELRSLSKTNTKAFWKTVHKFSNRKKEDPSVEIETFYDYFKKLNAGDEDVNDHDEININEICDNPVYDEILNGKITELEITEAIRKHLTNFLELFHSLILS